MAKKRKTLAPIEWHNEQRKISQLIPHPKNPRQMTEKQIADLTASLQKFNLAEIPVINTNDTLLAGHQRCRILALLDRADELIDVRVPNRELTAAEADEYLIRSNKNVGEWDWDLLANNFNDKKLLTWGFSDFDFDMAGDAPDDDPEDDIDVTDKIFDDESVISSAAAVYLFHRGIHIFYCLGAIFGRNTAHIYQLGSLFCII